MRQPSPTIAWTTDPHRPHANAARRRRFLRRLAQADYDLLVVTGDVGQADSIRRHLTAIADTVARPVHFVLGNHDFYGGSIPGVQEEVRRLAAESEHLNYLPASGPIELAPGVPLVGRDGWYDARLGNVGGTSVQMDDFSLIHELRGLTREERHHRMRELADEEAKALRRDLQAARQAECVLVTTHVPPFADAAWHDGGRSSPDYLPYFASQAAGEVLRAAAEAVPGRDLLVLCGHTHGGGTLEVRPNLQVWTGEARYGEPELQRTFKLGSLLFRHEV